MSASSVSLSSLAPSIASAKEKIADEALHAPKKMSMNTSLPNMPPEPSELLGMNPLDRTTSTPPTAFGSQPPVQVKFCVRAHLDQNVLMCVQKKKKDILIGGSSTASRLCRRQRKAHFEGRNLLSHRVLGGVRQRR